MENHLLVVFNSIGQTFPDNLDRLFFIPSDVGFENFIAHINEPGFVLEESIGVPSVVNQVDRSMIFPSKDACQAPKCNLLGLVGLLFGLFFYFFWP